MIARIAIWLLVSKIVHAQLNGEFWWLNKKVSEYQHVMIPLPKFENLTEFDNDESDKIVFRDDNLLDNVIHYSEPIVKVDRVKIKKVYDHFQDENKVIWPNNDIVKDDVTIGNKFHNDDINKEQVKKNQPHNNNAEMTFVFPDTKKYYISKANATNSVDTYSPIPVNNTNVRINKVQENFQDESKIVWPSDTKKKKSGFSGNFSKKYVGKEVKTHNPMAYNNNSEHSFVFPDTETDNFNFKDKVISNTEQTSTKPENNTKITRNELSKVEFSNVIKNNRDIDKIFVNKVQDSFQDGSKFVWPGDFNKTSEAIIKNNFTIVDKTKQQTKNLTLPKKTEVDFTFVFPDNKKNKLKDIRTSSTEKAFNMGTTTIAFTKNNLDSTIFFDGTKPFNKKNINKSLDHFQDKNQIEWPSHNKKNKVENNFLKDDNPGAQKNTNAILVNHTEKYMFTSSTTLSQDNSTDPSEISTDKISINDHKLITVPKEAENQSKTICTYLKKEDCNRRNGFIYSYEFGKSQKQSASDSQLICCILPLPIITTTTLSQTHSTEASEISTDKIAINDDKLISVPKEGENQSKTICTYLKKEDCNRRNGFIYSYEFGKSQKQSPSDSQLICCILPLPKVSKERKAKHDSVEINTQNPQIFYSEVLPQRHKRSNNEALNMNAALKQRDALLQRKYGIQSEIVNPVSMTQTKIVNLDSDEDPYWNIKNPKLESTNKQNSQKHYEYDDDYAHYEDELPKSGLVGLYSDHGSKPSIWTFVNQEPYGVSSDYDDVDDDETPSFGYSTIDPRAGLNTKTRKRGKPLKLTTNSEETYDAESQIINYQSNPDFHVLEGFKLLNLVRSKNRVYLQSGRKTTERFDENESKETLVTSPFAISTEKDEIIGEGQLFKGCGRSVKLTSTNSKGSRIGDTELGTHPWLALVVQTENLQNIVCYATLIHPRLAITTADCVYGKSQGELTVMTGLQDLNQRSPSRSRVPSIHFHPKYNYGSFAYGLAILKWKRPLRLNSQVQPVCLSEAQPGDDCKFFGWGGFDQAIRPWSRYQRAITSMCSELISANKRAELPSNAFCATVSSRATVTGIGGPLICDVDGRQAAVGVTVLRHNNVFILLPVRDWALVAFNLIGDE